MHAHPARRTANDRFKERSAIVSAHGVMVAVAIHFAIFALFPRITAAEMGDLSPGDLERIEPPPAPPLPPPPERIARPMNPVISADPTFNDATIPIQDWASWTPIDVAPPATSARDVEEGPVWVPRTVNPRLLNTDEVQRALVRRYPPTLRDAGIGGQTVVWLLVNEAGGVEQTRVHTSSERPQLDQAALDVAQVMKFAPAYNRDRAVSVWVALPIRFEARTPRP